jgi:hypothetical protein
MARLWYEDKMFLSYFAGFMDGEGTISLSRRSRGLWTSYICYVSVANSDYGVLEYIHSRIGFGTFRNKPTNNNRFGHKPMYGLYWSQKSARAIAGALLPYLVVKQKQAKIILSLDVKWGHNTPEEITEKRIKNETAYVQLKSIHGRAIN